MCPVIVVAVVLFLFGGGIGRRPFRSLEGDDIVSATVRLRPPDVTLVAEDTDELARLISEAVVYRRYGSFTDYSGQGAEYTLTLSDGTVTTVMSYSPYLIIDGVSYRAKYGPCEEMLSYANKLAGDTDAYLLESPPWLTVVCGDEGTEATLGSYSWHYDSGDGTMTGVDSDSADPLDLDGRAPLVTKEGAARFRYMTRPAAISSAVVWDEDARTSSPAEVNVGELELLPGDHIYTVRVDWDFPLCGGEAYYSFRAIYEA